MNYILLEMIRCREECSLLPVGKALHDDEARTKRRYLIKISKEKFCADCIDILQHQNANRFDDRPQEVAPQKESEESPRKRPDDRRKHTRAVSFPDSKDDSSPSRSPSSSHESLTLVEDTASTADKSDLQENSARERSNSRDRSSPSLRDSARSRSQSSEEKNVHNEDKLQSQPHKKDISSDRDISGEEQSNTADRKSKIQKKRNRSFKKKKRAMDKQKDTNVSASESDDDNVTSNERETHLSWLHEQRTSAQKCKPLLKGEHVLARWTEDGWYYEGIVLHYYGNCSYKIQDSCGYTERIWREDILQKHKKANKGLEINQHVIALHPQHKSSYAPGIIEEINDDSIQVKCYNNQVISVDPQEVYPISYKKYQIDVEYIKKKENGLVQSVVIARCDEAGAYLSGTVMEKHKDGQKYTIQWVDGSSSTQQSIHIFSAFSRLPKIHLHNYVLACSDPVVLKFLPGTVTERIESTYSVTFFDGTRQGNIQQDQCFWLEETYYREAVKFCSQHKVK